MNNDIQIYNFCMRNYAEKDKDKVISSIVNGPLTIQSTSYGNIIKKCNYSYYSCQNCFFYTPKVCLFGSYNPLDKYFSKEIVAEILDKCPEYII